MAARIPALEQRRFVGVQQAAPAVTPLFAPRKRGGLQVTLHGAQTDPKVLGNGGDGPALAVQRPDLFMRALSVRLALGRALLGRRR